MSDKLVCPIKRIKKEPEIDYNINIDNDGIDINIKIKNNKVLKSIKNFIDNFSIKKY